jgi:hypothetical protein
MRWQNGALFVSLLLVACMPGPVDRHFYFWVRNEGDTPVLVRQAFVGNVRDRTADPVYLIEPHTLAWVEPGILGGAPDRIEFLSSDCTIRYVLPGRGSSGGATIAPGGEILFDRAKPLPPDPVVEAPVVTVCANR